MNVHSLRLLTGIVVLSFGALLYAHDTNIMPKEMLNFFIKYDVTVKAFEYIQDAESLSVHEMESVFVQLQTKKQRYTFLRDARLAMKQARKNGTTTSFMESLYDFVTQYQQEFVCLQQIHAFYIKYPQALSGSEEVVCTWATDRKQLANFLKDMRAVVSVYKKYKRSSKAQCHLVLHKEMGKRIYEIHAVHDFLKEKGFIRKFSGWKIVALIGAGLLLAAVFIFAIYVPLAATVTLGTFTGGTISIDATSVGLYTFWAWLVCTPITAASVYTIKDFARTRSFNTVQFA